MRVSQLGLELSDSFLRFQQRPNQNNGHLFLLELRKSLLGLQQLLLETLEASFYGFEETINMAGEIRHLTEKKQLSCTAWISLSEDTVIQMFGVQRLQLFSRRLCSLLEQLFGASTREFVAPKYF